MVIGISIRERARDKRACRVGRGLVVTLLLGCIGIPGVPCRAQLPVGVAADLEQAEEAFFDGDFATAERVVRQVEKWLAQPQNQHNLKLQGLDYTIYDAFVTGLRAEILGAQGKTRQALGALRQAEKTLENRRQHYTLAGNFPPLLWQFEAFLHFVRGDLERPLPDFGMLELAGTNEGLRAFMEKQAAPEAAASCWREAEQILNDPRAVQSRTDTFRRLEGRLFVTLAMAIILKSGPVTPQDLKDADQLLQRAEAVFGEIEFWKKCVQGDLPFGFQDIDKLATNGEPLNPTTRLSHKRKLSHVIHDWMLIQIARAELAALAEQADGDAVDALVKSAEQEYDRLLGFLKANYPDGHPTIDNVRLSRARWYLYVSGQPSCAAATRISFLRDCLRELDLAKGVKKSSDLLQKDVLELAALSKILECDKAAGILAADERLAFEIRIKDLTTKIVPE